MISNQVTSNTAALPSSPRLAVDRLSVGFDRVTNSYKFYWFLALLDYIRETQTPTVPINHLLARMVAGVWYPTNYFRLSFGKQDRLDQIALTAQEEINLPLDARRQDVMTDILTNATTGTPLGRAVQSLAAYVPFRFLRPFFATELRGIPDWQINALIREMAAQAFNRSHEPCLYRFSDGLEAIVLHPLWFDYLQMHLKIVTGFCLWHLLNYLQRNNPNVPNIAAKLFEPAQRNLRESRKFWQLAFENLGAIRCIYSGAPMQKGSFSLDHFLP